MPKPGPKAFQLTTTDRFVLNNVASTRNDLFAQIYFDVKLFEWQQYFMAYPAKNKLVVAGIRTGKSFGVACMLLIFAYWNAGSRLLNVCITADQSLIIFNDIMTLAQSPKFAHWVERVVQHPYPVIRLHNGSEIWFRSIGGASGDASTIRGWEFDVINVDEAAYVVNEMAIRTLQGRLIGVNKATRKPRYGLFTMVTTPKGAKTWLYERWKRGDPQYPHAEPQKYLSLRARTYDNTLLDKATIEMALADYTERQRQQELEGLFISDEGLFNLEDLMACAGKDLGSDILDMGYRDPASERLHHDIVAYLREKDTTIIDIPQTIEDYTLSPQPGHTYVAGWDLGAKSVLSGRAEGRNSTVGSVLDISTRPWSLVAYKYSTLGRYSVAMAQVKDWHDKYNSRGATCFTRIDALGPGDVIHQMLEEDQYRIDGFKASTLTKGAMLQASAVAIERHWLRFPFIRRLIDQHQSYDPNDHNIAQDIVISLGQSVHLAREIEGQVTESDEVRGADHGSMAGMRERFRTQRRTR
jgi:hypothetical protein